MVRTRPSSLVLFGTLLHVLLWRSSRSFVSRRQPPARFGTTPTRGKRSIVATTLGGMDDSADRNPRVATGGDDSNNNSNREAALVTSRLLSATTKMDVSSVRWGVDPDWLRVVRHAVLPTTTTTTKDALEPPPPPPLEEHPPSSSSSSTVVELKTLIWEVSHSTSETHDTNHTTYVATVLKMEDRVNVSCLTDLVGERVVCSSSDRILAVRLAPQEVAERRTGYSSGTMAPICHTHPMPLYVDEGIWEEQPTATTTPTTTTTTTIVSVGSGSVGRSLYLPLDDMMTIAKATSSSEAVHVKRIVQPTSRTWNPPPSVGDSNNNNTPSYLPNEKSTAPIPTKERSLLTEYRLLSSLPERSQFLRTAARKKGRFDEMRQVVDEAVATGEFNDLMVVGPNGNPAKHALHLAAWKGEYETAVLLTELSQRYPTVHNMVNRISTGVGSYGKTPLLYALTQCRDDIVLYLLSQGASLLFVNNKGQTPCSLAVSHLQPDTCDILFDREAQELREGGFFVNYRESHSDGKLYGDLDPRFPIDKDNRGADIDEALAAYRISISNGNNNDTLYGSMVPSYFSPRSLRPTTRWWNRHDTSLETANLDRSGQLTFAQPRRSVTQQRPERKPKCDTRNEHRIVQPDGSLQRQVPESNLHSALERLTLSSVLRSAKDIPISRTLATIVEDANGIRLLSNAIDCCIQSSKLEKPDAKSPSSDLFLSKFAWGLDFEWKPGQDFGNDSPVATLQLATRNHAFLVDVQTLCRSDVTEEEETLTESEALLSEVLMKLFTDSDISLLGFGVVQDLDKLAASFPHLKCFALFHGVIDLQSIFNHTVSIGDKQLTRSLQKMVVNCLGKFLDKSEQCSDWTMRPLTNNQVEYATLDAAVLPYLLEKILKESNFAETYRGEFFQMRSPLRFSCRHSFLDPETEAKAEKLIDKPNIAYRIQVPCGSIKVCMSKRIARQSWPTKEAPPALPKLVEVICEVEQGRSVECRKKKGRKVNKKARPPPLPLLMIPGDLDNLPLPGVFLGYTKESCVYSVLGDQYMDSLPSNTYIGFNRRSGVVETNNGWILFVNFSGDTTRYLNTSLQKQLTFTLRNPQREVEQGMIHNLVEQGESGDSEQQKNVLLFARPSTRSKFVFFGECGCTKMIENASGSMDLLLDLVNFDQLIDQEDYKTAFVSEHEATNVQGDDE